MADIYKRRSPEEILAEVQRLRRGHHKIYVGCAPGVGKTYAMLQEARQLRLRGIDVVAGLIETHGRPETAAQIEGLEELPKRISSHHGMDVAELDVDGILRRNPDVVLVDELAHTNVPGSRYEKRYQDVEEILDAGINVLSTLNIQHLESLNDTVREITGIKVRETVPDSVLENADEIRLIDLAPESLIERLKEGRIYRGDVADRALKNFFRRGNLTALRELSLRAVADDTDDRLEHYMNRHDITDTWRTRDRILAAISSSPSGENLIRRGVRIAKRLKAEFLVAYVTEPGRPLPSARQKSLENNLRIAQSLGARITELHGQVADELIRFIREHHVTQVILGESLRTRWQEILKGSIIHRVLRETHDVDVLVVASARKEPASDRNRR